MNIKVFSTSSECSLLPPSKCSKVLPRKLSTSRTLTWYRACNFPTNINADINVTDNWNTLLMTWIFLNSNTSTGHKRNRYLNQQVPPHDICYKRFSGKHTINHHYISQNHSQTKLIIFIKDLKIQVTCQPIKIWKLQITLSEKRKLKKKRNAIPGWSRKSNWSRQELKNFNLPFKR